MKTLQNAVVTMVEGKINISADVVDVPFNGMLATRVSHGHVNPDNMKHGRRVQSSNTAVFVESRNAKFAIPNDIFIQVAAVAEPLTTFAPHFKSDSVPGNVKVCSEIPFNLQWQVCYNPAPPATAPHTPAPAAVWTDLIGETKNTLDETTVKKGQWIRCVATNAVGQTITRAVEVS